MFGLPSSYSFMTVIAIAVVFYFVGAKFPGPANKVIGG